MALDTGREFFPVILRNQSPAQILSMSIGAQYNFIKSRKQRSCKFFQHILSIFGSLKTARVGRVFSRV